ncbi:hypothetical protein [Caryophanon tenue]|nr:hypothetical protein [Caryophanon tenue]
MSNALIYAKIAELKQRDWYKKKYPSAMITAEGYFSALGATPHSGRVSQA